MKTVKALPMAMALLAAFATWAPANASEDFQLRYNLAGSLGGELFAPRDQAGWAGGLAATYMDINKETGNDGNSLT